MNTNEIILTKLCQIDASPVRLDLSLGAHLPEECKDECQNSQECKDQNPQNVQNVSDSHEDSTGNPATNPRAPSSVNFVPCGSSSQESNKQDHKTESSH